MSVRSFEYALGFPIRPDETGDAGRRVTQAPSWDDPTPSLDLAAGETTPSDFLRFLPKKRAPRIDSSPSEVNLWLRGEVTEVDREAGEFSALFTDERGRRSVAEVDLDSLDPRDREGVVVGAKFLYVVSREYRPDGMRITQQFLVDPIRKWTELDEQSASTASEDLSRFLDEID